jgi:hypothetical protein
VVRTAAIVVGEVVPTLQNSVFDVPSFNWYVTVYSVVAGVAVAFGTSCTDNAPPAPRVTLFVPAPTAAPSLLVNAGHEKSRTPPAGVPSALYTTSEMVVVAGAASAIIGNEIKNIVSNQ